MIAVSGLRQATGGSCWRQKHFVQALHGRGCCKPYTAHSLYVGFSLQMYFVSLYYERVVEG